MRQLVNQLPRTACECCIQIKLNQRLVAVYLALRAVLVAPEQRCGFSLAVGLDHADQDMCLVSELAPRPAWRRSSDAGRRAEITLSLPCARLASSCTLASSSRIGTLLIHLYYCARSKQDSALILTRASPNIPIARLQHALPPICHQNRIQPPDARHRATW